MRSEKQRRDCANSGHTPSSASFMLTRIGSHDRICTSLYVGPPHALLSGSLFQ
jgi:hypothetical protein